MMTKTYYLSFKEPLEEEGLIDAASHFLFMSHAKKARNLLLQGYKIYRFPGWVEITDPDAEEFNFGPNPGD